MYNDGSLPNLMGYPDGTEQMEQPAEQHLHHHHHYWYPPDDHSNEVPKMIQPLQVPSALSNDFGSQSQYMINSDPQSARIRKQPGRLLDQVRELCDEYGQSRRLDDDAEDVEYRPMSQARESPQPTKTAQAPQAPQVAEQPIPPMARPAAPAYPGYSPPMHAGYAPAYPSYSRPYTGYSFKSPTQRPAEYDDDLDDDDDDLEYTGKGGKDKKSKDKKARDKKAKGKKDKAAKKDKKEKKSKKDKQKKEKRGRKKLLKGSKNFNRAAGQAMLEALADTHPPSRQLMAIITASPDCSPFDLECLEKSFLRAKAKAKKSINNKPQSRIALTALAVYATALQNTGRARVLLDRVIPKRHLSEHWTMASMLRSYLKKDIPRDTDDEDTASLDAFQMSSSQRFKLKRGGEYVRAQMTTNAPRERTAGMMVKGMRDALDPRWDYDEGSDGDIDVLVGNIVGAAKGSLSDLDSNCSEVADFVDYFNQ